ncbi:hypothetical protein [uncultured Microbulbifer sp.]|uniref:hypothetical protein n=1 Tax=uncultured Microbulbifer sp. TaxID=348147 RepID=UPI0026272A2B|nr:hypothetical protein [uncultured Microbulbifer sp.]
MVMRFNYSLDYILAIKIDYICFIIDVFSISRIIPNQNHFVTPVATEDTVD